VAAAPPKALEQMTTVYVGKIPPGVEDDFVRKLLEQCGKITHWRRVADPVSGKLKGFGFCDFESPQGVLRALRILPNFKVEVQQLLLKVDEKTQKYLDEYTVRKQTMLRARLQKQNGQHQTSAEEDVILDEEQFQEDERVRDIIKQLVETRERGEDYRDLDIDTARLQARKRREKEKQEEIAESLREIDKQTDAEKVSLVSREIRYFREKQAQRDAERPEVEDEELKRIEKEKRNRFERDRERGREQRRKEREDRDFRDRERDWEGREKQRERERDKEREKEKREKEREARDAEFDDSRKSREYVKFKKEIEREKEEDESDKLRELQDEEWRRREEIRREEERQEREYKNDHIFNQTSTPSQQTPISSIEPTNLLLDRSKLSGFALSTQVEKKAISVVPGFNAEPEVDELYTKKKRKLVTLESSLHKENDRKTKLDQVKSVIEKIPKEKDELFAYEIDWDTVQQHNIVEKKMRPWIDKKIVEYLGEEEKTLTNFITSKMASRVYPSEILGQLQLVLDEEAEIFVVKMWRMLIFELLTAKAE